MQPELDIKNIKCYEESLVTPAELKKSYCCNDKIKEQIQNHRRTISDIINGDDERFLLVCGPCSIHDPIGALEYADSLKILADKLKNRLYIIMRVYLEKPRTSIGWKGFINDPDLDNTFNIEAGLARSRELLLNLTEKNLPLATEALNLYTSQYLGDLFSWMAIGARTTESQPHREMVSGIDMPIGFKNTTQGNIEPAINAIIAAAQPHKFISINQSGRICVLHTPGNPNCHLILRGGYKKPNFDSTAITQCEKILKQAEIKTTIIVDCSHDNSQKDFNQQPNVAKSVIIQRKRGNKSLVGLMLESNLHAGNQRLEKNGHKMRYGVSVTDACISWETTKKLIIELYQILE
ncbi:MAG: 3-deoxy-7-phosphoheptulonate synthase [Candidatus Dasytiphilus stammeri]